ncbi:MAG: shikimate dehydrogenase [Roseburia sp.]|nr:shikimate dehydrogenase [Roseburia sp.]
MYKSALLGRDISYTRSPEIHSAIAGVLGITIDFRVADVPYDRLDTAVAGLLSDCDGFFITKPYKQDIKRYLDRTETRCGVNFVRCGDKTGFNTDGAGFMRALERAFGGAAEINSVLVLGSGGAAYSVAEALVNAGKRVFVLNRTLMHSAKLCAALGAEMYVNQPAELIVNCTSAGLHGEDVLNELCVMPDFEYAYDLIYSPPETPFLRRCKASGAKTCNGRDMLVYQAIEGDRILTGKDFDVQSVFEAVNRSLDF